MENKEKRERQATRQRRTPLTDRAPDSRVSRRAVKAQRLAEYHPARYRAELADMTVKAVSDIVPETRKGKGDSGFLFDERAASTMAKTLQ